MLILDAERQLLLKELAVAENRSVLSNQSELFAQIGPGLGTGGADEAFKIIELVRQFTQFPTRKTPIPLLVFDGPVDPDRARRHAEKRSGQNEGFRPSFGRGDVSNRLQTPVRLEIPSEHRRPCDVSSLSPDIGRPNEFEDQVSQFNLGRAATGFHIHRLRRSGGPLLPIHCPNASEVVG